jgi:hypothetical protein
VTRTRRQNRQNSGTPQPCNTCGTLVADFSQWFAQSCEANPEGHQVENWMQLEFKPDAIAFEGRLTEVQ